MNEATATTEKQTAEAAQAMVQETLEKFLNAASVYAVYGEPIQSGDTLVIPSAEVISGVGFGTGFGTGMHHDGDAQEDNNEGSGGGGGGGGRVRSRPVAVVVASPNGVHAEPVIDNTKIALTALVATGLIVAMLLRLFK